MGTTTSGQTVAVFGAYGHTGRFVVAELRDRGYRPRLLGRDERKLQELAASYGTAVEYRVASVDDPASLDAALDGAAAVVNSAGPFASTAGPVIEAAIRAGIAYVDVAAEIEANVDTLTKYAESAEAAGVPVVPAMAFYGGLDDLLATTAMGDWTAADEVHVAYGLSSWHPTGGTLLSGTVSRERREGRRVRYTGGRLEYFVDDTELPTLEWDFPGPMGRQTVMGEFTMADVVTIPSHLAVPEVRTYMTTNAVTDLVAADTSARTAVDDQGRSDQSFIVDVIVRSGGTQRRITASGQDIYAFSAPLAVEAVHRILDGRTKAVGVASAGRMFDAPDFLRSLSAHISVEQFPETPAL